MTDKLNGSKYCYVTLTIQLCANKTISMEYSKPLNYVQKLNY